MPRIPLVEPGDAPPAIQDLYAKFPRAGGPLFNVIKMFGNNEHFLEGMLHLLNGLYSEASKLSPRYRELAYLRASQLNSCHY